MSREFVPDPARRPVKTIDRIDMVAKEAGWTTERLWGHRWKLTATKDTREVVVVFSTGNQGVADAWLKENGAFKSPISVRRGKAPHIMAYLVGRIEEL